MDKEEDVPAEEEALAEGSDGDPDNLELLVVNSEEDEWDTDLEGLDPEGVEDDPSDDEDFMNMYVMYGEDE
jgi:hypothetical protein